MKHLFYILIFSFALFSCATPKDINEVTIDPDLNEEILIGRVNDEGLKNYSVFTDTEMYYNIYDVNAELAETIKSNSENINLQVVFGSWCGDSKINVSAFRKIVDVSKFKKSNIEYIAVNRKKEGGSIDVSELKVKYVPTFIFYRSGKEIGRIVEYPNHETIEEDWVEIVTKK